MKFQDIESYIASCKIKVGDSIAGATVDEIVPVPTSYFNEYLKYYVSYLHAEDALSAFCEVNVLNPIDLEYGIIAVCNKSHIQQLGAIEYCIIE